MRLAQRFDVDIIHDCFRIFYDNVVYNFPETKIESWREIRRRHENDNIPVFEQALLPDEITEQLKTHEFKRLRQVLIGEARVFVILARFSAATFAGEFRALHTTLNENGEIIATLSRFLSDPLGHGTRREVPTLSPGFVKESSNAVGPAAGGFCTEGHPLRGC